MFRVFLYPGGVFADNPEKGLCCIEWQVFFGLTYLLNR